MAYLVSKVTEMARQHDQGFYPDDAVDGNGDPLALDILNEAHAQIVQRCELYNEETVVVNLVAAQREYSFDPTVFRVNACLWHENASTSRNLRETSIDEQDKAFRAWRTLSPGTPYAYYLHGTQVGFVQTPNVSTIGGYPFVSFAVTRAHRFTSLSDPMPAQLPSLDAYVWNVLWRWAIRHNPEAAPGYAQLASAALKSLGWFIFGRTPRKRPVARPSVLRVGNP